MQAPFIASGVCGLCTAALVHVLIIEKRRVTRDVETKDTGASSVPEQSWSERWGWLVNFPLWCLLVSSGFTMFQLRAVSDWATLYFVETLSFDNTTATFFSFWNEVRTPQRLFRLLWLSYSATTYWWLWMSCGG